MRPPRHRLRMKTTLLNPDTIAAIGPLWRRLAGQAADAAPWLELAERYDDADLPWQSAFAARQALKRDAQLAAQVRGLRHVRRPPDPGGGPLSRTALPVALALRERFQAWIDACPGDWLTWLFLARLADLLPPPGAGPQEPAPRPAGLPEGLAFELAKALEPIPGESLHWLGVWRLEAGDAAGATTALAELIELRPTRFDSLMFLGEALMEQGQRSVAETAYTQATQSSDPDFLATLAARVSTRHYWPEAMAILQKAVCLRPNSVPLRLALARAQFDAYVLADCQATLLALLEIEPGHAEARLLLASLPGRLGDAQGHLAMLLQSLEAADDPLSRLVSQAALTSLHDDSLTPAQVADLHRRLCAPMEAALPEHSGFDNPKEPQRRLKLGLLTGDLHRQHPVNLFMLPVLQRISHKRFKVAVYYTGTLHDEYTRRARESVHRWVDASAMADAALRQMIAADGVDILVDLAGHSANHRLGVMAMRAAPVQASFLGYPHSSGLSRIDWLIGDAVVSPQEHAELFSEGIAQLPGPVFCWAPVDDYPLPPARAADAPLVFGSFNHTMKLSPRTLRLWARVLQAVPGSKLLLKAAALRDASVQARIVRLLQAEGIEPARLMLHGPTGLAEMMQAYGQIDIALDPTPCNGGTVTLQALWMGVPVVSLIGGNFVSRMGASFLRTLGHPEWLAEDEDGYVGCALRLAAQVQALRTGRATLRAQMLASPLCRINAYVRGLEALLLRMWQVHCSGEPVRLLEAGAAIGAPANTALRHAGHGEPGALAG